MVEWGRYQEAYKAIHDAILGKITGTSEPIDKIDFTYNADGNVETVKFCVGASVKFTLTFGYDANKKLTSITRS